MNGKYDKGAKQRELSSSWLKSKHWTSALRNRACRYASLVNANFSVNQMCPIICRWKLVKHRYCFGDNRRTKDNRKIVYELFCLIHYNVQILAK